MIHAQRTKPLHAIGFLTVTRDSEHGLFGGYLVLNTLGRPLEFHCTAPVRPNRAQEILYGRTLDPYLCGERIGSTLLKTSKRDPLFVLTDVESVLAARELVPVPILLVCGRDDPADEDRFGHPSGLPGSIEGRGVASGDRCLSAPLTRFDLGPFGVAVTASHASDSELVTDAWPMFERQIDLEEPFERIREAIGEARNSVR